MIFFQRTKLRQPRGQRQLLENKQILRNISRFLTSRFRQIAFLMTYDKMFAERAKYFNNLPSQPKQLGSVEKKHLLGVRNLWTCPLEDGENESANENPPSRNSKQIHHGVKVFLNSHFKLHPSFLYKFATGMKPLEVFWGIVEAFNF